MAQSLRTHSTFVEDLNSVHSTHVRQLTILAARKISHFYGHLYSHLHNPNIHRYTHTEFLKENLKR